MRLLKTMEMIKILRVLWRQKMSKLVYCEVKGMYYRNNVAPQP